MAELKCRVLFVLSVCLAFFAQAQTQVQNANGNIRMQESALAADVLRLQAGIVDDEKFMGYAIQVGSSASKAEMEGLKLAIESDGRFSDLVIDLVSEVPNYKLRVGAFLDKFSANKYLQSIIASYPDAILVNTRVKLSEIKR